MSTKKFIYGLIFSLWAIIIGSYFTESELYQEIALVIFLFFGVAGGMFALYGIFHAIRNMFRKDL